MKIPNWAEDIAETRVSYNMDLGSRPGAPSLAEVLPGLPDAAVAASIDAVDLCDEDFARWLQDPSLVPLPRGQWPRAVPRAKMHFAFREKFFKVAAAQHATGILVPIAGEDIFHVNARGCCRACLGCRRPAPRRRRSSRCCA